MDTPEENEPITLLITYRGKKNTIALTEETSLSNVKSEIISSVDGEDDEVNLEVDDIKIIYKGKILSDENESSLFDQLFSQSGKKKKKSIRLLATGVSSTEAKGQDEELKKGSKLRMKDDLTDSGKRELAARERLGRKMMMDASKRMNNKNNGSSTNYGFGRIETLPMLSDRDKAKGILTSLANDPGILACLAKHKWNVECLAEMYPEGKVGESEVCVMGLNQNKGQKILLRIRTDDLRGFRKILSIRKVLYHELAHNVHSDHDTKFFQLMRQIENECNEMDWTQGSGISQQQQQQQYNGDAMTSYEGGSFRLGGNEVSSFLSTRELAARAALKRSNQEEEQEILNKDVCGCGQEGEHSTRVTSKSVTTSKLIENDAGEE